MQTVGVCVNVLRRFLSVETYVFFFSWLNDELYMITKMNSSPMRMKSLAVLMVSPCDALVYIRGATIKYLRVPDQVLCQM